MVYVRLQGTRAHQEGGFRQRAAYAEEMALKSGGAIFGTLQFIILLHSHHFWIESYTYIQYKLLRDHLQLQKGHLQTQITSVRAALQQKHPPGGALDL